MKWIVLPALVFVWPAAAETSLAGKWVLQRSISGNESISNCTFTQTGNEFAGTCGSERGELKVSGKVDGTKVSFMHKSEYQGSPLTVTYSGKVETDDKLNGSVTVEEFGVTGEFTAKREK